MNDKIYILPFSLSFHHGTLLLRKRNIYHLLFLTFWQENVSSFLPFWFSLKVHNLMYTLWHLNILDFISQKRDSPFFCGRSQLLQNILIEQFPAFKSFIYLAHNPYPNSICQFHFSWCFCWVSGHTRSDPQPHNCIYTRLWLSDRLLRRCG